MHTVCTVHQQQSFKTFAITLQQSKSPRSPLSRVLAAAARIATADIVHIMALWCAPLVISVGVCTLLGLYCLVKGCFACALVKWPARLRLKRSHSLSASSAFTTSTSFPTTPPKLQAVVRKPLRWCEVTCRLSTGHAPARQVVLQSANGRAQSSAVLGLVGTHSLFSVLTSMLRVLFQIVQRAKLGSDAQTSGSQ